MYPSLIPGQNLGSERTSPLPASMNGAGSAGNPWITDLSTYNTANSAGKILKDRLSKAQYLGLK